MDDDTRRFQAQSARLMGDMKEAGDAPFRGEVELDSKVSSSLPCRASLAPRCCHLCVHAPLHARQVWRKHMQLNACHCWKALWVVYYLHDLRWILCMR